MKQTSARRRLAAAVAGLVLASCGGGGGYGGAPTAPTATTGNTGNPATTVVSILGNRGGQSFAPEPVTVRVGQAVAWRNQDGIVHRVVQDRAGDNSGDGYGGGPVDSAGGFDGGNTAPGATSNAMTLSAAGTIRYHCQIHPGMVGTIVVQP